jgi:Protein of unknown function (DUF1353)
MSNVRSQVRCYRESENAMAFAVKWIFELQSNYEVNLRDFAAVDISEHCVFEDSKGVIRLELFPAGRAVVKGGYAWDGCTPKFSVFDIVVGVPDGVPNRTTRKPKAYYASLMHDVLYQFLDAGSPVSRAKADKVFLGILARDAFAPGWIYYAAVRVFGGLTRLIARRVRRYAGRRVVLPC